MTATPTDRSSRSDRLTVTITDAVADAEDCDPAELTPLYQTIDPDALETVFDGRPRADGKIAFEYHGYTVVIVENGLAVVGDDALAEQGIDD